MRISSERDKVVDLKNFTLIQKLNSCHHCVDGVYLRVFQLCFRKSDKDLLYYQIINHQHDSPNPTKPAKAPTTMFI